MSLNYFDLNSVTIETRFAPWTHGHSIDAITGLRGELDSQQSGLTSTSDIVFHNAGVYGDIVPNSSAQVNLGSETKHFKTAWIDELHLAENTLYLGDTPVIGTNASTVEIKADEDQGISVKTTGTGETKIISSNGIEISNSGMNGQIAIQSTGAGGSVSFGATTAVNFTAPDVSFSGNLEVGGNTVFNTATFTNDVVFQGDNITMNTTHFVAEDNRITLNSGEVGDGVTAGFAGFDIDRGNYVSWQFVFDEANDQFVYGPIGGSQFVVTNKAYVDAADALKLNSSAYTAADVFTKVTSLDGAGSGLDADKLDGYHAAFFIKTAQDYMDSIQSIDGTGSGLDADKLDGHEATYFAIDADVYSEDDVDNLLALKLDSITFSPTNILNKIKTVDGSGSGLDADLLDGHSSAYFSPTTHNHNTAYLGLHAKADDADKLDGLNSSNFARFSSGGTIHNSLSDAAWIANYSSGNVDHIWHDDSTNTWNFCSDTSFKSNGNSTLRANVYNEGGTNLSAKYLGISAKAADANLLDGHNSTYFAVAGSTDSSSEVDAKIAALVDGSPAALNTLNELAASLGDDPNFATTVSTNIGLKLDISAYTAADILAKIRTVDGTGSGLDADSLDGHGWTFFSASTHNHDSAYLEITAKAADSDKLDGHDTSYFATSSHNHNATYLGISAKAADSNLLDGLDSTKFARTDIVESFAQSITVGTTSKVSNTTIKALAADGYNAGFESYGGSQGTGYCYVGQSASYGGGFFYNGDGTPAFSAGEVSDRISFYRRNSSNNEVVFSYAHDSNNVVFRGTISEGGTTLSAKYLGKTAKAADANLLDGHDTSYFSPSTHTHSALYLGLTAKAADADKLDGLSSGSFIRSDATDTASGVITFSNVNGIKSNVYDARGSQLVITAGESLGHLSAANVGAGEAIWLGAEAGIKIVSSPDNWASGWAGKKLVTICDTAGNSSFGGNVSATTFSEGGTTLSAKYLGKTAKAADANLLDGHNSTYFLTTTGKAADANLLDGINSSSFLRSDATDYLYSDIVVPTANRDHGMFGTYVSTKTQHIWSMGVAYRNAADGASFGNLYGLAYKYNGSAGGHGTYHVINGSATCGMGTNLWTSGLVKGRATSANYADLAEKYTIEGNQSEPGQVVLIGSDNNDCIISDSIASQQVLGVVSTNPGLMMNAELENGHYVALKGRVPCSVFGKVKKGEALVSFKDGMAIGINHEFVVDKNEPGIIFGKALKASNEVGVEVIEVVVL